MSEIASITSRGTGIIGCSEIMRERDCTRRQALKLLREFGAEKLGADRVLSRPALEYGFLVKTLSHLSRTMPNDVMKQAVIQRAMEVELKILAIQRTAA